MLALLPSLVLVFDSDERPPFTDIEGREPGTLGSVYVANGSHALYPPWRARPHVPRSQRRGRRARLACDRGWCA